MATYFEAVIADTDKSYAEQVSQALFAEIDRLESLFSRFDPGSEISRINRLQLGQSLRIGIDAYECLKTAENLRIKLGNAFDINYKLSRKDRAVPQLQLNKIAGGFTAALIGAENEAEDHRIDLDLGGIGKGYALDQVVELLADWSIENVLLHAGTSTALALGSAPSSGRAGWPVGVAHGWDCYDGKKELCLIDRALSSSGTEVKGTHVTDPHSGRPASGHAAAWVSCASAAVSDVLSTAFMVMNTDQVQAYCEAHPDVWALVFVDEQNYFLFNPDVF